MLANEENRRGSQSKRQYWAHRGFAGEGEEQEGERGRRKSERVRMRGERRSYKGERSMSIARGA